eukprot:2977802-Pyramimonas_sp.AAC.1
MSLASVRKSMSGSRPAVTTTSVLLRPTPRQPVYHSGRGGSGPSIAGYSPTSLGPHHVLILKGGLLIPI